MLLFFLLFILYSNYDSDLYFLAKSSVGERSIGYLLYYISIIIVGETLLIRCIAFKFNTATHSKLANLSFARRSECQTSKCSELELNYGSDRAKITSARRVQRPKTLVP